MRRRSDDPVREETREQRVKAMSQSTPQTVTVRGRTESVLETIRVGGRRYFALERLSRRDVFRVFDPHAGPRGDYRVLYRLSAASATSQRVEVLRRLGGPNGSRHFPGIVDFARQRGELYVVVAWVWGVDLREYLQAVRDGRTPRPATPEVVRLVRELAHGVAHYHRRATIVHGDLSPANIVLTAGAKHLVLVDFGGAWPVERTASREQDEYTLPYAAPERIAKHAPEDFRADLFSLSVVAYELLTTTIPYDGLGGRAGLPSWLSQTESAYRPPSTLLHDRARLPREAVRRLDESLRCGLQLRPDDRFATSGEWLDDWDELHASFKTGGRLNRVQSLVVAAIDAVARLVSRRES